MHGNHWMGKGACSHCGHTHCRCGAGLHFAAFKLGFGLLSALKSACYPSMACGCTPACTPSVIVHALQGERRVVPYLVKNDTQCPIKLTPEIRSWSRCGSEEPETSIDPILTPGGPVEIAACGSHSFDIVIDAAGLKPCACYSTTLLLNGTCCHPVTILLYIGGKVPAVCRHDTSRLRAWVRGGCSGGPGYVAPPVMVHGSGHHGCGHDGHGHHGCGHDGHGHHGGWHHGHGHDGHAHCR